MPSLIFRAILRVFTLINTFLGYIYKKWTNEKKMDLRPRIFFTFWDYLNDFILFSILVFFFHIKWVPPFLLFLLLQVMSCRLVIKWNKTFISAEPPYKIKCCTKSGFISRTSCMDVDRRNCSFSRHFVMLHASRIHSTHLKCKTKVE